MKKNSRIFSTSIWFTYLFCIFSGPFAIRAILSIGCTFLSWFKTNFFSFHRDFSKKKFVLNHDKNARAQERIAPIAKGPQWGNASSDVTSRCTSSSNETSHCTSWSVRRRRRSPLLFCLLLPRCACVVCVRSSAGLGQADSCELRVDSFWPIQVRASWNID